MQSDSKHIDTALNLPSFYVLMILLIEGFCTISTEVLAIRSLIPFSGNSVIITSLIIGIFLLFLSLGYWAGGRVQQRYTETLSENFLKASLVAGVGLSVYFLSVYFYLALSYLTKNILVVLTLYLLLVISPVVYWLGQTIPITTNLFKQSRIAHISGNALFINTLGSFLGAVVTSALLMNYLGVAATVFVNSLLLMLLATWMSPFRTHPIYITFVLLVSTSLFFLNISTEKKLYVQTNSYGNYSVNNNHNTTDFNVNLAVMSQLDEKRHGALYLEKLKSVLFKELKLRHQSILVIGAGGFTLSAEKTFDNRFDYLDIDPQIKTIAEEHFLKQPVKGRFIANDARAFFKTQSQQYDVIIADAYKNINSLPASLATRDFFLTIKSHLKPGGLAVFNVIASPFMEDTFSKSIDNTIRASFHNCLNIPTRLGNPMVNMLYLCKKTPFEQVTQVYTDDLNRVTLDQMQAKFN